MLINEVYPATAVANASTIIIRITKENFMKIISEYPDVHHSFTCLFASRLFDMALIAKEIAVENPEHRVHTVLQILKKNSGCPNGKKYKIELSRQRIADITGLRVETVIRAIKKLEEKQVIIIEKGKVYI